MAPQILVLMPNPSAVAELLEQDPARPEALWMPTYVEKDYVTIRPFRNQDAAKLYTATHETIDLLCAWMTWCHPDYCLEDARSFIALAAQEWKSGSSYSFAIVDTHTEEILGSAGLSRVNKENACANLGYWVRSSRSRRGIASEAIRQVARFGLRRLGLHRLEIVMPEGHLASQRVAQNAGAKFEGILRGKIVLNAKTHDAVMYSLLPADLSN